jgi:hypothetical protein
VTLESNKERGKGFSMGRVEYKFREFFYLILYLLVTLAKVLIEVRKFLIMSTISDNLYKLFELLEEFIIAQRS